MCPLVKPRWAEKQNKRTGRAWIDTRDNCTDLDPLVKEPKGLIRGGLQLELIIFRINYFHA
jgi:hypothetical protein